MHEPVHMDVITRVNREWLIKQRQWHTRMVDAIREEASKSLIHTNDVKRMLFSDEAMDQVR